MPRLIIEDAYIPVGEPLYIRVYEDGSVRVQHNEFSYETYAVQINESYIDDNVISKENTGCLLGKEIE